MGKKGSAPSAPDPVQTAGAQTGMNIGTAVAQQMGSVNQITPYGNKTYNQTGMKSWTDPLTGKVYDLPQYTVTQTLSPGQQKLMDAQTKAGTSAAGLANQQLSKLGSILGTGINTSGAPGVTAPTLGTVGGGPRLQTGIGKGGPITTSYGDEKGYAQQRKKVEDTLLARMNPSLEQERGRLSAQLANQGIKQGTEAYDRAMQNYGKQTNDARYGAILGAGEEQSRLAGLDQAKAAFQNAAQAQGFGQGVTRATFGNDALQQMFANRMAGVGFNNNAAQQGFGNQQSMRKDYLSELFAKRNQPINEIAALLGTGQVQNPNFAPSGGPAVANTDYAGLVNSNYQGKLAAWQAQQQANSSLMGGLFGLGGSLGAAGILASDRRLKTDVSFLGMLRDLPIYAYRYIWGGPMHVGVVAQDMLSLRPDAVVEVGGFLAVDYSKVLK